MRKPATNRRREMKKMVAPIAVAVPFLTVLVLGSAVVFAGLDSDEIPGKNVPGITDFLSKLESEGYEYISSIEFDDSVWEVETLSNGKETEYRVNPETLEITKLNTESEDDMQPPKDAGAIKEALKLVRERGYDMIRAIEFEKGFWEVHVVVKNTEKEITVDVANKKILREKVD